MNNKKRKLFDTIVDRKKMSSFSKETAGCWMLDAGSGEAADVIAFTLSCG